MDELALLADADRRAHAYLAATDKRRAYPDAAALAGLAAFDEPLPDTGRPADDVLRLLDERGTPATVASNGPNYFGFVIGATLPAAAAAERLMLAWDQCASSFANSPVAATIERQAARWIVDVLGLPEGSAVGFGTSATACTLVALVVARRALLARKGWDVDEDGLIGAPEVKVAVSELVHVTVKKALRVLGFGMKRVIVAPVDPHGRIERWQLRGIFAGLHAEDRHVVDPFAALIPLAKAAGAWVHVDGAFGLWARASSKRALTNGIDGADSWTTDGHKWLNTPYDGAMVICRDAAALATAMNSDAVYLSGAQDAQKNLNLEFSRRARGIPVWAALRALGRAGVATMIERHCAQAARVADGLRAAGYDVLNRVVLNQVLVRAGTDDETTAILQAAQDSGDVWFGSTVWQGRPAFRISVSSWRTEDEHTDRLVALLTKLRGVQVG
ncbi:pyridoxal phosphate-dependent decarboxylase family protein [Burkholderia ambifaria]|uniref:pyridoxal phosphate-dependent decarboxylase family protein n=1 Tax=Burkholderia ambifaria TaxID=152480 RepID=UPI002FE165FC